MNLRNYATSEGLLFSGLIALALLLLLPGADRVLSGDEATTFLIHGGDSWRDLTFSYLGPNQHTLFSLLSNLCMSLFGENEIAFRLPALLAGILSVPLTYRVAGLLLRSRAAAAISALLLALSFPHWTHSQQGRGYSLTVLLALLTILSLLKLSEGKRPALWGGTFMVSGLALVLALPSNLYFLLAAVLFFLLEMVQRQRGESRPLKQNLRVFAPVLVGMALVAAYLLIIYSDLVKGIEIYNNYARMVLGIESLEFSLARFFEVVVFMVSPWGLALLFFVVFGWRDFRPGKGWGLLILFAVPLLLVWVTGMLGPPRAYFYVLPFLLMAAAGGAVEATRRVSNRFSKTAGIFAAILIAAWGLMQPVVKINETQTLREPFSSMQDAKLAREYISEENASHRLIVFPYQDLVLRRYIEERVAAKMWNIFQDGRLDGVTFIAHRDVPLREVAYVGINRNFPFREASFEPVRDLGRLRVYRLQRSISRFFPDPVDADYEGKLLPLAAENIEIARVREPKVAGEYSLRINKPEEGELKLSSPFVKEVNLVADSNQILLLYAKKFRQKSTVTWVASNGMKPQNGLLNFFFGVFRESGFTWQRVHPHHNFRGPAAAGSEDNFLWQIVFSVYPIEKGKTRLTEGFMLYEKTSYFDGIQSFIFYPQQKDSGKFLSETGG